MSTESSLSVEHFRGILVIETKNLTSLCESWSKLLEANGCAGNGAVDSENNHQHDNHDERVAAKSNSNGDQSAGKEGEQSEASKQEEIFGAIRSTIGQAKLLMSQRFKQFSELIDDCECQKGQHPTRLEDLLGFWEMISYQVDDVMKKFKSLEAARECGQIS